MPTTTANGTQLYYEITGDAPIPVVLVHGSWGDHHNWDRVVPGLARSFTVLTFDRRGHSRSARSPSHGSLTEDAMDLAALLEALGLAPAHVVGNSGGAAVALRLATLRPALFRSLVVHEPPLFGLLADDPMMQGPLTAVGQRIEAVVAQLRAGDHAAGAKLFVETIAFGPGGWDQLPAEARQTFIDNAPTFLDETEDADGFAVDLAALSRFPAPALLSRGEASPPFFPAVVARLGGALPRARQHLFAGAGHVPHLSHPDAFVQLVTDFVRGADAEFMPSAARDGGLTSRV